MSIGAISDNMPSGTPSMASMAQRAQGEEELTTVTTHCSKHHQHDQSCPHTVSTRPAPRLGEPGYLLDEKV